MIADRTTETIAHFIGLFDLAIEQARMREGYEEFTATRRHVELNKLEAVSVDLKAPHKLSKGKDALSPIDEPDPLGGLVSKNIAIPPQDYTPIDRLERLDTDVVPDPATSLSYDLSGSVRIIYHHGDNDFGDVASYFNAVTQASFSPENFFPGSVVTATSQAATLNDSDTFGTGGFWPTLDFSGSFSALSDLAGSLHAIQSAAPTPGEIPRLQDAKDMAEAMLAARTNSSTGTSEAGVVSATIGGAAAVGLFFNGVAVDEAPSWMDLLPDHFRDSSDDDSDAAADAMDALALPDNYVPNADFDDGHTIVAGGNYLVNEAKIYSSWVDAPLFAVGGSWMQLDHISQVAVASNNDIGAQFAPTTVAQIAEVSEQSAPGIWHPASGTTDSDGPQSIFIDHIEGDLLISHNVKQVIDVIDEDHFSETISAASSAFVLGENIVLNAFNVLSAGLVYDMIVIGGDMIQYTSIMQTLVLADDDRLSGVPQQLDSALPADQSHDPLKQDSDPARPMAVQHEDDIDPLGDESPAAEIEAARDNLLFNEASIEKVGLDTATEASHALGSVLSKVDEGLETMREALLSNPLLSGLEQARVLMVDGDLIQSMIVDQTTRLRDNDDINVQGRAPEELEVISGSNALLNAASIKQVGMDSKIMAAEDSYSDILIHQAQLIDEMKETADETNDLVSEAVAFLTDDLQERVDGLKDGVAQDGQIMTAVDADDLMASMLA